MKKEELMAEYAYYYESYIYYDAVKQESNFAEINLAKCNLLADLFLRYYAGDMEELQKLSLKINKGLKEKYPQLNKINDEEQGHDE